MKCCYLLVLTFTETTEERVSGITGLFTRSFRTKTETTEVLHYIHQENSDDNKAMKVAKEWKDSVEKHRREVASDATLYQEVASL